MTGRQGLQDRRGRKENKARKESKDHRESRARLVLQVRKVHKEKKVSKGHKAKPEQPDPRGLRESRENKESKVTKYNNLINVKFYTDDGRTLELDGTVFGKDTLVLVTFFGYEMNVEITDYIIAMQNDDVPGVIGKIATILGNHNINIVSMHWGRKPDSDAKKAQSFVATEVKIPDDIIDELSKIECVNRISVLDFED